MVKGKKLQTENERRKNGITIRRKLMLKYEKK